MRFFRRCPVGAFPDFADAGLLALAGNSIYGALQARWAEEGRPSVARERVYSAEVTPVSSRPRRPS